MTLQRYVARICLEHLALAVLVLTGVFLLVELFELAGAVAERGVAASDLILYVILRSPEILYLVAPMAVLIATMTALAALGRTAERSAIAAGGGGPGLLLIPAVAVATLFALLHLAVAEYVIPYSGARSEEMQATTFHRWGSRSRMFNKKRHWFRGGGRIFRTEAVSVDGRRLHRVLALTMGEDGRLLERVEAERVEYGPAGWEGTEVRSYRFPAAGPPVIDQQTRQFLPWESAPEDFRAWGGRPEHLRLGELNRLIRHREQRGEAAIRYRLQRSQRFAIPLAIVWLGALGAAVILGSGQRRTVAATLGVAALICLGYWLVYSVCLVAGARGMVAPGWSAWFPTLAAAAASLYRLRRIALA